MTLNCIHSAQYPTRKRVEGMQSCSKNAHKTGMPPARYCALGLQPHGEDVLQQRGGWHDALAESSAELTSTASLG